MGTLLQIDESGEDGFIINSLIKIVRRLLCLGKITPQQTIALGTALYALERFPETTGNRMFVVCEMSTSDEYYGGYKGTKVWHFSITNTSIRVSSDGVEHGPAGSDSYRRFSWGIEGETREGFPDDDFKVWLREVEELFNVDFELTIKNESDISNLNR